ncbi:hypothetical protein SAMN04488012_10429 [Palleronia salina]|uniref:YMGG-like Gly-zipper n=1 Tax=Palleronia salina TaxID=313368 RepID=A0A1M6FPQ4_9RHOB|nr:hypothetical protein [Palleronia salina]SHI99662.1 hypothetical protein SAMN04488012_10429 [Palleronia salina]
MTLTLRIAAVGAFAALAACGNTDLERAGTGAVGGAVAGEVVSGDPITGAALGAAAGAVSDDI